MPPLGSGHIQQKILKLLADGKPRTGKEIADELGIARNVVGNKLQFFWNTSPQKVLAKPTGKYGKWNSRYWVITEIGKEHIK